MKNALSFTIVLLFFISCKNQNSVTCEDSEMKDVNIYGCKSKIKIPKKCILQDTLRFDRNEIMNYEYRSVDSSLLLFVYVKRDDGFPEGETNFLYKTQREKKDIVFGTEKYQEITDTIMQKDKLNVGYLKYLIKKADGEFISCKIFFIRDKRFCGIDVLEKYNSEEKNKNSVADCILESLRIY